MSSLPESASANPLKFDIKTKNNSGTVVGQLVGGTVINIYWSDPTSSPKFSKSELAQIGENPYKGLQSFKENDSNFFFGRSQEIEDLRQRFCTLYKKKETVRLLPIYGPSGSGKSSLARAGLVPALARESLLGYEKAKVVVLKPGEHPLESLTRVLASIKDAGPDQMEWARQFRKEIDERKDEDKNDWLRYIAIHQLQDSEKSPLIILIDQFEEVYTQCKDKAERDIFVGNLLCAAENHSTDVFVIITFRVDFLSETQQHSRLNQLLAKQGVLVPVLSKQGLEEAICKPAELAGSPLDKAVVPLLIQQVEGREGALPLLQFTLTRIWDRQQLDNKHPNETLNDLGGVYKALATEAERVYKYNLTESQQQIARRVFIGLVQIGEGTRDTRRRIAIGGLMSYQENPAEVIEVIRQFAEYDVRLISLSGNKKKSEISEVTHKILAENWDSLETYAEITHEALLEHWNLLKVWIDNNRNAVRTQREIEVDAKQWEAYTKSEGYLLHGSKLAKAEDFKNDPKDVPVSKLIADFIQKSKKRERLNRYGRATFGIILFMASILALSQGSERQFQEQFNKVLIGGAAEPEQLPILFKALELAKQQDRDIRNDQDTDPVIEFYKAVLKAASNFRTAASIEPGRFREKDIETIKIIQQNADDSLAELIRKFYFKELVDELEKQKELRNQNFGQGRKDPKITSDQNWFTKGSALNITYRILMQKPGLGAGRDYSPFLDDNGAIYLPCNTLRKINELWRDATNKMCGLIGEDIYSDRECPIDSGATISYLLLNHDNSSVEALQRRIKTCPNSENFNAKH